MLDMRTGIAMVELRGLMGIARVVGLGVVVVVDVVGGKRRRMGRW